MAQQSVQDRSSEGKPQRLALIIAGVGFIAFLIGAVGYLVYGFSTQNPSLYMLALFQVPGTLAWGYAFLRIREGQSQRAIELALAILIIVSPLNVLVAEGIGVALAVGTIIGTAVAAGLLLPLNRARWFFSGAALSAALSVYLDASGSTNRVNVGFPSALTTTLVTIVGLVCLGVVAIRFRDFSLRTKLIVALVGIAALAAIGVSLFATQSIRRSLEDTLENDLRTRAEAAALSVGITIDRNVDRLQTLSLDGQVQGSVAQLNTAYPKEDAARQALIQTNAALWAKADPQTEIIRDALNGPLGNSLREFGQVFEGNRELFITDGYGSVVGATDWQPQYNFAQEEWWKIAYNDGRGDIYIGQPEFVPMLNDYGIRIGIPIFATGSNRAVGVVQSIYTLSTIERVLLSNSFGNTGKIDVLFPMGQILTADGTFRALTDDEFAQIKDGIGQALPTLNYRGTPLLSSQGIVGTTIEEPEPYLRSSAWRTIATIQPDEALAAADAAQRAALLAGLAAIAAAVVLALLLAQFLTQPIRHLTTVAAEVQAGDLSARAPIETGDEIGVLARTFNSMTTRLQDTLAGLERRVSERTQELSQANQTLQSNSAYLSALSDTSTGLFQRLDRQAVLQAILERAGALVGTQHGFVFIQEPNENDIQMRVGSGVYDDLVGTQAQRGVGLAGTVWETGQPMVIEDYQKWEGRLPGSRRDALHAIVAVPLKHGGDLTNAPTATTDGVIGLAFTEPGRQFGATEVEILQRFAQLASIAIDNARLYADSEARVEELGALNKIGDILTTNTDLSDRLAKVGRELHTIFGVSSVYIALYDNANNLVQMPFFMGDNREISIQPYTLGPGFTSHIIQTRQPLVVNEDMAARYTELNALEAGEGTMNQSYAGVPMTLGDTVLGVIGLSDQASGKFQDSDVSLLNTIAATIATAIQNARLFAQTNTALAQTAEQARRLERLNQASAELARSNTLHQVIKISDSTLVDMLQPDRVSFALLQPDGASFQIYGVQGDVGVTPVGAQFALAGTMVEDAVREQRVVYAGDITRNYDTASMRPLIKQGLRAIITAPLVTSNRVIGALNVSSKSPNQFSESDVNLTVQLASLAAAALQSQGLIEETRAALAETQRLAVRERESGEQLLALNRRLTREGWRDYLDQVSSHTVFESAEANGNGGNGNGGGYAIEAPENGSNGHKIRVPISLRGQVIGEIELEQDEPTALSADDLGLVSDVAENIGLALDNARLFTETQRRMTELDALNRISQAVTTELDVNSLLTLIGDQIRENFDVQNVYIALYDRATQRISLPYFVNDGKRVSVEPIQFGEGITSHIIRTRAPLVINDHADLRMAELGAMVFGNPARSYLGVPIFVADQVIGVISIQSMTREGMFDQSNVRLLETIAATVGTAIQNAQLYGAMQEEVVVRQRAEEEIKLSLQEKEVLLKEIHHRVKNNLQIISSLLNLQSAQIKDTDTFQMFRESQSRVRSMALIHEKLYQSKDLARIDFDGYVKDLVVYLFRSYAANPDQIHAEIETGNMFLGIDTAIPCGLIISELVTNSLKYAFPDGKRGSVRIGVGAEENGLLQLQVVDTGVGFRPGFDWREADSLGLQLVNTLSSQLHGTVHVQSDAAGTAFRITFPE